MPFCDDCGSFLQRTAAGYWCSKCRKFVSLKPEPDVRKDTKPTESAIYVISSSQEEHSEISEQCPKCGGRKALQWLSSSSGEHAGVNQERTLQHFRCASCGFEWVKV